jgi:hypothetical protein
LCSAIVQIGGCWENLCLQAAAVTLTPECTLQSPEELVKHRLTGPIHRAASSSNKFPGVWRMLAQEHTLRTTGLENS